MYISCQKPKKLVKIWKICDCGGDCHGKDCQNTELDVIMMKNKMNFF